MFIAAQTCKQPWLGSGGKQAPPEGRTHGKEGIISAGRGAGPWDEAD